MSPDKHCDSLAADAFIHLVADQLIAGLRLDLEPCLVHVTDAGPGQREVGVKPLDGCHPSSLLVGFTAPDHWHALGMATHGFAYHVDQRGSSRRNRIRVSIVTLISRSGEVAQRMDVPGDVDLATTLESHHDDVAGEQIDLLRLALGLPTDGPPCPSDVYWAVEWLSALLGAEPGELTRWSDVAARHPAMSLLDDAGGDGRDEEFVQLALAFGRVCTWSRLRALACEGKFVPPELVPADGAWFDDGSFARFLLNRCPPLAMLRHQVRDHLDGHLADRLEATLDALGIPGAVWPDVRPAAPDR